MDNCIFCKIINKELPAKIKFENENFIAFDDIHPKAKVHILLITKKHIPSLDQAENSDSELLGEMLLLAKKIAHKGGLDSGYRLVVNVGKDGGQEVDHLHMHIMGG